MPTFQPSKYSPPSRLNPDSVKLVDPQGAEFTLRANGMLEFTGGNDYNGALTKGQLWDTTSGQGSTMLGNLSTASAANKAKVESVLSPEKVEFAEAAAYQAASLVPAVSAGESVLPPDGDVGGKVPLTKQPWFWPVVIIGVAGVVGVGIWYKQKGAGDEMGVGDAVPA